MKIKYYGTGTSGAIPEMFCSCRVCEYARSHGGKDIRQPLPGDGGGFDDRFFARCFHAHRVRRAGYAQL